MSGDPENELGAVIASAQELIEWERVLGGVGFPEPLAARSSKADAAASGGTEDAADVEARLRVLVEEAAQCTRCELHRGRTKSVFARGSPHTDLVFVGEGPGYHEDQQGLPFVGRAGQLLDRMIAALSAICANRS